MRNFETEFGNCMLLTVTSEACSVELFGPFSSTKAYIRGERLMTKPENCGSNTIYPPASKTFEGAEIILSIVSSTFI